MKKFIIQCLLEIIGTSLGFEMAHCQSIFTKLVVSGSGWFNVVPHNNFFYSTLIGNGNISSVSNYHFAKFDSSGSILWQRRYGGALDDRPYHLSIIEENGNVNLLCLGESDSFQGPFSSNTKIYAVKLSGNGDTLWTRIYGRGRYPNFCLANDSNYMIAWASGQATLIKVNPIDGDTLWTKNFTRQIGPYTTNLIAFTGGIINVDSGFIIAGSMIPSLKSQMMLMRTNEDGKLTWCKTYGDTAVNNCWAMARASNGGYLLVGQTANTDSSWQDFMAVRIDQNGNLIWSKRYDYNGGAEIGQKVIALDSGRFVIFGKAIKILQGMPIYDKSIGFEIDSAGNIVWSNEYNWGYVTSLEKYYSGFIMCDAKITATDSTGNSCNSQPVILTASNMPISVTNQTPPDSSGLPYCYRPNTQEYPDTISLADYCLYLGEQNLTDQINEINIFPNPANANVTISCDEINNGEINFSILNALGVKVFQQSVSIVDHKLERQFNISELPSGFYVFRIETTQNVLTQRFIKL